MSINKKFLFVVIFLILLIIVGIFIFKNNFTAETTNIVEYTPEEEIGENQIRQTIISLYYKNTENNNLVPEARTVDVKLLADNPYLYLLNLLIECPKGEKLQTPIPAGTKINNTYLNGNTLYVDFSEEFIKNHSGGLENEKCTINSIVNTLTELNEVSQVKILINGKENQAFNDNQLNFTNAFTRQD